MKKLSSYCILAALVASISCSASAQTIPCRLFSVGCKTPAEVEAEIKKTREYCARFARSQYSEYLKEEGEIDKEWGIEKWKLGGYESLSDAADSRVLLMNSICLRMEGIER